MDTKRLEKLLWIGSVGLLLLIASGIYGYLHHQSFGAIPQAPALFETSLAIPQGTGDTSMTLSSATLGNGSSLTGYYCFTVDSNTSLTEYECGTASTTNPTLITGLVRGVDPQYGTTSVASLIFSHRVGADVRVTDFPLLSQITSILGGTQALTNPIIYSGVSTSTLGSNANNLASVGYVNSTALQGAPLASTILQGLVQAATALQTAAGQATGTTGALLFPQNSNFASSSSSTTLVPVTQTNGKLNQNFLDLTQGFTFTGLLTDINATTTFIATTTKPLVLDTVPYVFPNSQGVASTTLFNDGSGNLSWGSLPFGFLGAVNSTASSSVIGGSNGSATVTIASIAFSLPKAQRVLFNSSGINGALTSTGGSGAGCNFNLYVDNANLVTFNKFLVSSSYFLSPTFASSQLSSGSHTASMTLQSLLTGGTTVTCTDSFDQFSAYSIGN